MSLLVATGVGVRHRRRWIVRDVDLTVEPGDLVAIVGHAGSGRTTTLLALTERFKLSAGKVRLVGKASLGHVANVEQPENLLTVADHVRERLALLGRSTRSADAVISGGLYGLDPKLQGWELTPYQKQVLGVVLARLADPAVIALDGIDEGLDPNEQDDLWRILGRIATGGVAILVTAREMDPARVTTILRLSGPPEAFAQPAPEPVGQTTPEPGQTTPEPGQTAPEPAGQTVAEPAGQAATATNEAPATTRTQWSARTAAAEDGDALDATEVLVTAGGAAHPARDEEIDDEQTERFEDGVKR
ncbi:ABC-2 type transport system ATP-binding protein [Krasilnikovia cinnamomea]|uniref:ABC-2 type transport system ATP-binding protein n=1 Tax=Krasilnikovia cinnamomea TaxID=349313 RepID=A0A4Q7ZG58_9ACTN|nr:ATP-binding cassette domain-containing protein [Krasilnikovia cinnamomea]RZU49718.1 ABC-2 type transport system ATP-binding protein [Krasilnikovia cinnamomea]